MHQSGYGALWSFAMSFFIYAGSMQYMSVSLLTGGVSLLTTALTTLVVNARHLFYGISMIDAYKNTGKKTMAAKNKLYLSTSCPKTVTVFFNFGLTSFVFSTFSKIKNVT